jgi:hypothetical protein
MLAPNIHHDGEGMARTSVDIDIDMAELDKVRRILGTESLGETISAAFRAVIRTAAIRDLVALGKAGAFDLLLEPGADERMARYTEPARWIVPPDTV